MATVKSAAEEQKKKVLSGASAVNSDANAAKAASNPDSVMSQADQKRIQYYRDIYNSATDQVTKDAAHKAAEDIRATYGYSGGADGSQYITEGVQRPAGTHNDAGLSAESQKNVDNARLQYYIADANNDAEGRGYWHQVAENERAKNGYSGGADGSERINVNAQQNAPVLGDLAGNAEDYSSYLEQMYAAKKAAALAEIEAAYKQNMAALDRAGEGLDKTYQDARNQTAGASELAKRNFAQYAAANGLNSGAGGQAELARNVTLQNNMNSINSQEAQSVADLQLQRANAEVEYNNAIAQAQAEGDYELANALYQEKVRVQNALIELEVQRYQLEYQAYRDQVGDNQWQQSFDYGKERDTVADGQWQQSFDYGKERDTVADGQWQQSFDQSVAQQNWQNLFNQQQFDYGKEQDAIANGQWQQTFDQGVAQQDWENRFKQTEYDDSKTQIEKETLAGYGAAYLEAGIMPSAEMLAAMGITEADAQAYINNYRSSESKSQSEAQKKTLASYGASYLEAGIMPSAEMLAAMGITEADAQAYISNYQSNESKSQSETQKKTLASYGASYLEAGIMPSAEMLAAMGITEADAKLYITAVKNADRANFTTVGEALTEMVRAGANMTELRSALRGALNEGILTQAEYEQLCGIYLPGWRT